MKLEPPPRRIRPELMSAIRKERRILSILAVVLILSGIGIAVVFWLFTVSPRVNSLDIDGSVTEATITAMKENRNVRYGSRHPWTIEYGFITESGEEHEGHTETTDLDFVHSHKVGDTVTVSYDQRDPSISKIQSVEVAGLPFWLMVFPGSEIAAGLFFFILWHRRISVARDIYEQGTETEGRIRRAKVLRSVHMGRKNPLSVEYVFEEEFGQEVSGKAWSWHEKARSLEEGQACTVLYNRTNPAQSLLYDVLEPYLE